MGLADMKWLTTNSWSRKESSFPVDSSLQGHWHPVTLIAFCFAGVYCLLEWVPLVVMLNTDAVTVGMLNGPLWWRRLNITVGQWSITHFLGLPEHSPPRFATNYLPLFLGMVSIAVASAFLAVVWFALSRRRTSHPQLFVWLHTLMRFTLGSILLSYGWTEILPGQFPFTFDYFTLEVGQHNPTDLLWAFMGASREYQVFAGSVEVAAGMLLMTRRTAMLGALVSAAAMANVLALDIAYDVNAKFLAGQIFLASLFVLAPFLRRLVSIFILNHEKYAAPTWHLFREASADRVARSVGVLIAAWLVFSNFLAAESLVEARQRARKTPLYGIWEVEETSRGGVPIPPLWTDATLWRRLVIQDDSAALIVLMSDSAIRRLNSGRYSFQLDQVAQTILFTPFPFSGTTQPLNFTYVLRDSDQLVLNGRNPDSQIVMRLRRIDPSSYPLIGWKRSWRW